MAVSQSALPPSVLSELLEAFRAGDGEERQAESIAPEEHAVAALRDVRGGEHQG